MKIILLQDVQKLGHKYDIKDVSDGYARNFLIPNKLAESATENALSRLQKTKEQGAAKAEGELRKMQAVAGKIDGLEMEIKEKMAEDGTLFGSIGAQKIADKLKEAGLEVNKSQIKLGKPIKEKGEYEVKIDFGHNLESQIKVIVIAE